MDNKCPRCDDYDEITEELKKEKENRERGAKDDLRKCEDTNKSKNKKIKGLEKKILTITIIAVVAGTVLGKEVLDKIASYLESFNSIKSAATKLTTSVDDNSNEVAKKDGEQEEIVEYTRTLTFAPRTIDTGDWPSLMSTSDIKAYQSRMNQDYMLPLFDIIDTSEYEVSTLADILLDDMLDEMILSSFTDDVFMIPPIQSTSFEVTPTIPYSFVTFEVPESPSVMGFALLPLIFPTNRRM